MKSKEVIIGIVIIILVSSALIFKQTGITGNVIEIDTTNSGCGKYSKLDLALIVDTSELDESDELGFSYEWQQICNSKSSLLTELKNLGINVNMKIYGIAGTPDSTITCMDETANWADPFLSFNERWGFNSDEEGEYWGPATQDVLNRFNWQEDSEKIVIIISDSDPTGYKEIPYRKKGYYNRFGWRRSQDEEDIIERTWRSAKTRYIKLSILRPESILLENHLTKLYIPSPHKLDVLDAFETVSKNTRGTIEIYDKYGLNLPDKILEVIDFTC